MCTVIIKCSLCCFWVKWPCISMCINSVVEVMTLCFWLRVCVPLSITSACLCMWARTWTGMYEWRVGACVSSHMWVGSKTERDVGCQCCDLQGCITPTRLRMRWKRSHHHWASQSGGGSSLRSPWAQNPWEWDALFSAWKNASVDSLRSKSARPTFLC